MSPAFARESTPVTPMGLRDNPALEIKAGQSIAEGAKAGGLKPLVYTSVLGADTLRGVGILDAKYHIERAFAECGVPSTILRCGSYMEDVFDPRLHLLKKGKFLFPLTKERRFTYTSQQDVPRFVVEELLPKQHTAGGPFNFVSPGTFSIREVEALLSEAAGFPVKAPNKIPAYYAFLAAPALFQSHWQPLLIDPAAAPLFRSPLLCGRRRRCVRALPRFPDDHAEAALGQASATIEKRAVASDKPPGPTRTITRQSDLLPRDAPQGCSAPRPDERIIDQELWIRIVARIPPSRRIER